MVRTKKTMRKFSMFFVFVPLWVPGISLIKWPIELHMLHIMKPNHSFVSYSTFKVNRPQFGGINHQKCVVVYCCQPHHLYIYIHTYTYIYIYIFVSGSYDLCCVFPWEGKDCFPSAKSETPSKLL